MKPTQKLRNMFAELRYGCVSADDLDKELDRLEEQSGIKKTKPTVFTGKVLR